LKLVLIGKSEVGKTSIKKVVFELKNPDDLIIYPLEPTRGIDTSKYSWINVDINIFDTSGQELPFLLEDKEEQIRAFESASIIIYVLDYPLYTSNKEAFITDVEDIHKILHKYDINAEEILFFHKIDLISHKRKKLFEIMKDNIYKSISLEKKIPIFFTSIKPKYLYTVFNAFSEVFIKFSKELSELRNIIKKIIEKFERIICIITDDQNNVIIQTMTEDIKPELIRNIYRDIPSLTKDFEIKKELKSEFKIIGSGTEILGLNMEDLKKYNQKLNKLILISHKIDKKELTEIRNEFLKKINKFYSKT
jgi:GTPase SAR1 family protein